MSSPVLQINAAVPGSRYHFTRQDGAVLELPRQYEYLHPNTRRRISAGDRLRADGAHAVGDETYEERKFSIHYAEWAAGDQTKYRANLNELEGFFRREFRPYYLVDSINAIRTRIVLIENRIKEIKGNNNQVSIGNSLECLMIDGLWEDQTQSEWPPAGTSGVLSSGQEIAVDNLSNFDAYPEITIIAQANVVVFILENTTVQGGFQFESNDFLTGRTLFFSSVTGTVTLDGVEKSAAVSRGGPIIFNPGANTIRYESPNGPAEVLIRWRRRYAF